MANYIGTRLKEEIKIDKLYTVHYFEYSREFEFTGERHDFWELVYVDKGNVRVDAEDQNFLLKRGEVIFHKPNEWHNIHATGVNAPNVEIITFASHSPSMRFFENKILSIGQRQKELLSKIISEYTLAFQTPLNDVYTQKLERRKNGEIAAEQLIRMYLCEFLILFLRNNSDNRQKTTGTLRSDNEVLNLLLHYMDGHILQSVTLRDLMQYSGTNRTAIERLFHENFGKGALEYFSELKIELAKQYLREGDYNITQIAELLGYSSIHYFSRRFKQTTDMTPTEYQLSIKSMLKDFEIPIK